MFKDYVPFYIEMAISCSNFDVLVARLLLRALDTDRCNAMFLLWFYLFHVLVTIILCCCRPL